jgi:hypothetical protein
MKGKNKQITIMIPSDLLTKIEKEREHITKETGILDISRNQIIIKIISEYFSAKK